jgi:hypothetical protein
MTGPAYRDELERLATAFRADGAHVTMRGDGTAAFLLIELGPRGAEFYWGDDGGFTVDLAMEEELLGEVRFASLEKAVAAIWSWLKDGVAPAR